MSLNPLKATEKVVEKYLSYLETTFAFSDKDLHNQLIKELWKPGKFAKGPILEATPPFEAGCTIEDLINDGVLSEEFRHLNVPELPVDRSLYLHQEQAVRKLVAGGRNIIVSTGTGSGKTESFLIPILNYLFRQQEEGTLGPGVRALLLYPMNALANDQLKRLRKVLKNYPEITFGSYTGETKHEERQAVELFRNMNSNESPLENELLSRARMKDTPPHILLTNYAMLEYLLLRPEDNVFFDGEYAQDWRFIVIDEAHTYSGAKGIEMSMLLRRLKDRVVLSEPGALQCIGTSATLGDENDLRKVAEFGSGLFSEPFEWVVGDVSRQDVVTGKKKNLTIAQSSWGTPPGELYTSWMRVTNEEQDILSGLYSEGTKFSVPSNVLQEASEQGDWAKFIYTVLAGDGRLIKLQTMLEAGPCFIEASATELFSDDSLGQEKLVALVDLANKARLQEGEQPLLPARYHLFIRAIEGGYISLLPEKQFFLERRESVDHDGYKYPVFEASTCRRCNSLYLTGETRMDGEANLFKQPGRKFNDDRNALEYYLFMESGEPVPDNEDELVSGGEVPGGEKYRLCGRCGAIGHGEDIDPPCACGLEHYFEVIKVDAKDGNVHKCPACGSTISVGSVVRRFVLGAEAVTSVLGTALYQQIPEHEGPLDVSLDSEEDEWGSPVKTTEDKSNRRLLIFSDSRQDAAYFATYLQNSYNQILQRCLLIRTLEEHREKVIANRWRVNDLADFVKRALADLNLYPGKSLQALEAEAWKWVLQEFMASERIGLEGLGLLGFSPVLPAKWSPPEPLMKAPWNLSSEEAVSLIMILLDSVRKNTAVNYPDSVDPKDDFFSPRNREYFFNLNSPVQNRIYSWCPSKEWGNNTRLDYLVRLAKAAGYDIPNAEARDFLAEIWTKLLVRDGYYWRDYFSVTTDGKNGVCYRLKPEFWELRPAVIDSGVHWYRCDKCKRLTLYNIRSVCPTYRCDGRLHPCEPDKELAENHYRRLYLETLPLSMSTLEHTAQLTTERAAEIQKEFYDGKVNILSCSTTFELGVDVGELETVFMRNVPPSAANYIQRAGRAGRRTSSTAFVLTFAQRRSHDFTHFADPLRIIKGEIRPPYIEISNEKIVRRHLYAVAIALFWRLNPHYYGNVKNFFLTGSDSATLKLLEFLRECPKLLELSLSRIVPEDMKDKLNLEDWAWVEDLLGSENGVLIKAEAELVNDIDQLRIVKAECREADRDSRAAAIQRVINTLENRNILSFLSQRNVIPKYGFPVDVVELQIHHHGDEAKGLELSRDLKIALSEYAPESQVVAGGKLWTSRYLKKLPDREPVKYNYAICQHCGRYRSSIAELDDDLNICSCGEKVGSNKGVFLTPEFGFIAGPPRQPGMTKPQKTYSTRKYFSHAGSVENELELELGGVKTRLLTGSDGKLAVINNAGVKGFRVCGSCGFAEIYSGAPPKTHKNIWGKECKGRFYRYSLGYEFKTDILQIWFPDYYRREEGFWESLLYGILEGVCGALDIERQDIDGTLFPYNGNRHSPALVLFDDVPGGAGHVKRIAEEGNIMAALQKTFEITSRCECGGKQEDSSCYGCLRSYSNQYCHDILNRGFVMDLIGRLLGK